MKKIFFISLFFALLLPTMPAIAQCGDCQTHYEVGKGPGEEHYLGGTILAWSTAGFSSNMSCMVMVTMSNGTNKPIPCYSGDTFFRDHKLSSAPCTGTYRELGLVWEPGYYAPISGTWIPGRYKIVSCEVKAFTQ